MKAYILMHGRVHRHDFHMHSDCQKDSIVLNECSNDIDMPRMDMIVSCSHSLLRKYKEKMSCLIILIANRLIIVSPQHKE